MDEVSAVLLDRLIEETFANMAAEDKLAFVEKLFRYMGPWRMCCRMMADIDRAEELGGMDTAEPARLFQALADENRIKIIKLLTKGERRVDDLTHVLDTAQSTVSHHLRILKDAGMIHGDKRGRNVFYSLVHPVEIVGDES
jgi:DNA-binding transcriptional ArsR family regulator